MYDDAYPTCHATHATLLIYPGDLNPEEVTQRLGVEPSHWQRRGEVTRRADRPPRVAPISGWFLGSRGRVRSKDSRRHIDWVLDQIASKATEIQALREAGCRIELCCYWCSESGHGGPTMSPSQMRRLADLNIELWFDFYGPYEEEDTPSQGGAC